MPQFDKDLIKWAEEVIKDITPFAKELNKDFYPLQSAIMKRPDVLFLGLNPGGGRTYESQSTNDKWDFEKSIDSNYNAIYKMKPEKLLSGNPYFDKDSEDWKIIKGLKRIKIFSDALDSNNFVLANYYFLSTTNFKEVQSNSHKDAVEKCKNFTDEMINLINPKLIVVLGTATGIDKLNSFKNKKNVLLGHHMRLLVTAEFNKTKCIAIPHPSTFAITQSEAEAINQNLIEFKNDKDFTDFNFPKINWSRLSIEIIENMLQKNEIHIKFKKRDQKRKIYETVLVKGDDELLVSLNFKSMYLGIRDFKAKTVGPNNRFYVNLNNSDIYIDAISEKFEIRTNSWLIKKHFGGYVFETIDSLMQKIVEDLTLLFKS